MTKYKSEIVIDRLNAEKTKAAIDETIARYVKDGYKLFQMLVNGQTAHIIMIFAKEDEF